MHMQKERVYIVQKPVEFFFSECAVNPSTSRGPTWNFATCRDIARTLQY